MGEAYLSILLGGQLFSEKYRKANLHPTLLSRSLEEGATYAGFAIYRMDQPKGH